MSEVSNVVSFFSLSCQEGGFEMNMSKKQSGSTEKSIPNGPSGFSEKLGSTGCYAGLDFSEGM